MLPGTFWMALPSDVQGWWGFVRGFKAGGCVDIDLYFALVGFAPDPAT